MQERIIKSTKGQIEDFKESLLWKDFQEELIELSRLAQLEYDLVGESHVDDQGQKVVPNQSETLIHLGDIKGRRKAVKFFLSLPDILLQMLEDKEDDSRRK